MAVDDDHDGISLNEDPSANGETMSETGNSGEELRRIELDLAYCSEKVLNLDKLLIHVESRLSYYDALNMEDGSIPADAIEKALEFDALSGILYSELKELDNFVTCLLSEIIDSHQKMLSNEHIEVSDVQVRLHDAEESLKQVQEQVVEIRIQSAKFESTLALARKETWQGEGEGFPENDHASFMDDKWKMHTVEQQRHVLQILEKSLARELDLEKKLSDSVRNEEELQLKLQLLERETYGVEEHMTSMQEWLFESENAAEVFMLISNELLSKLQIAQFTLNNSLLRERDMRSTLEESLLKLSCQESALQKLKTSRPSLDNSLVQEANSLKTSLKEAEDRYVTANSEVSTLRENVNLLEEKLRESDIEQQRVKSSVEASEEQQSLLQSDLIEMELVIENLRETVANAERRADNAESKCILLSEINLELNEEPGLTKSSASEKEELLERKLRESDAQLEHAKASIEAIEEQQGLLYTALGDMENLIEDLKAKSSKAETKAENAESKCTLLSETNLELNEELGLLRSRLEVLEKQLRQAEEVKMTTAKDIGIKTKAITDLVVKLASERERLQVQVGFCILHLAPVIHIVELERGRERQIVQNTGHFSLQISSLTKENQTLVEDWWKRRDSIYSSSHEIHEVEKDGFVDFFEESVTESSTTDFQVENQAAAVCMTDVDATVSVEDATAATSNVETVRSIEAGQLNSRLVLIAFLVLAASICGTYLFQLERCPF